MSAILELSYLLASISFVIGLKMLGHPDTARRGNLIAAAGMGLAVVATLALYRVDTPSEGLSFRIVLILIAIAVGSVLGTLTARRVQMTAMPEMVSLFNGMGGACAALIGLIEYLRLSSGSELFESGMALAIVSGLVIGSVSLSGSIVAFLKLNGRLAKPIRLPKYNIINSAALGVLVIIGAVLVIGPADGKEPILTLLFLASLAYGVLFVLPIGGADMPVVISLLNSFTGVAAACGGFLYGNQVMLTGGILVGSAGTLLTVVMCKAMNRSLASVIFGAFGGGGASASTSDETLSVREASASDVAIMLAYANKVAIIPGYGLAVAQAQHACHELERMLVERGVEVKYGIHPVAGRMPGHMNVLLAESDVSYDLLVEMEDINSEMPQTDVVLVIGANDVVNPAAKNDPSSPIYGMPILEVEEAKQCIVLKRGMSPGYAGVENELFYRPKTQMLFGDAKKSIQNLIAELKTL
jgi:NAD(P) transhydrogenase subunit beta